MVDLRKEHGAAKIGAELVAVQARRSDASLSDGVVALGEFVVPIKLPQGAVIRIRAALGDHVDLAARRSAVLGRIGTSLDLELGQRVDRGRKRVGHGIIVHLLDAIQVEAVGSVA